MADLIKWIVDSKEELAALLLAIIAVGEIVTRLTPTTSDDGFVERIGGFIKKALDAIGLPNKLKGPDVK